MANPCKLCLVRKPGDVLDVQWATPAGATYPSGIPASVRPSALGVTSHRNTIDDWPSVAMPINAQRWRVVTKNPAPGLFDGGATGYAATGGSVAAASPIGLVTTHKLPFTEAWFTDLWAHAPYYYQAYNNAPVLTASGANATLTCDTQPEATGPHAFAALVYNAANAPRTVRIVSGGALVAGWSFVLPAQSWRRIAGYVELASASPSTFGLRVTDSAAGDKFLVPQLVLAARPTDELAGTPPFGVPLLIYDEANGSWPKLTWSGAANNSRSTMEACAPAPLTWAQSGLSLAAGAVAMRFFPPHPGHSADVTSAGYADWSASSFMLLAGGVTDWTPPIMQAWPAWTIDVPAVLAAEQVFEIVEPGPNTAAYNSLLYPLDQPFPPEVVAANQDAVAAVQTYVVDWSGSRMHVKLGTREAERQRRTPGADETAIATKPVYLASVPPTWDGGPAWGLFGYAIFDRPLTGEEIAYLEAANAIWHPRMFALPTAAALSFPATARAGDTVDATLALTDEHGAPVLLAGKEIALAMSDNAASASIAVSPAGAVTAAANARIGPGGVASGQVTVRVTPPKRGVRVTATVAGQGIVTALAIPSA